jgi:hypothetical protein
LKSFLCSTAILAVGPTGILPVENYSAARKRTLGARQQHESLSVTKSYSFDHMIIAN